MLKNRLSYRPAHRGGRNQPALFVNNEKEETERSSFLIIENNPG
jgi:hypothetical protein